jgi:hypothetical protein
MYIHIVHKLFLHFAPFYRDPTPNGKEDMTLSVEWEPVKPNVPLNYLDITGIILIN